MIPLKVSLTSSIPVYHFQVDLNRSKRFEITEFYENICKMFWQGLVIFLREVILCTQFNIIFVMIKVSKKICFKIIGSHHTLIIIVICKTIVTTEPISRTYCEGHPLSSNFKVINFTIWCRNKGQRRGNTIKCIARCSLDFYVRLLKAFLK